MLSISALNDLINSELRSIGIEESERRAEADLIMTHATGLSLAKRLMNSHEPLTEAVETQVRAILVRRKQREPLQYCLGETYFFGLPFQIREGVLIPRADTETLVHSTIAHYSAEEFKGRQLRLGEIGIGSGIISVSLLKHLPEVSISACDISASAVQLSLSNAARHNVSSRLSVSQLDWKEWLYAQEEPLDGIISNPPYIPAQFKNTLAPEVALWEPSEALFGSDEDGLGFYRDFARLAKLALCHEAAVFLEIGFGQADSVADIFCKYQWRLAASTPDLNGIARALSFVRLPDPFEISEKLLK